MLSGPGHGALGAQSAQRQDACLREGDFQVCGKACRVLPPGLDMHLDRIHDGVVLLDHDYRVVYQNRASKIESEKYFQRSLVGECLWDFFPKAAPGQFQSAFLEAKESGSPVFMSEFYEPLNIWLELAIHPSSEGLWVYTHNITDLRDSERTLRDQEFLFRAILDASSSAIFVKDEQGRYLQVNRRAAEIFGRPASEIVGRTPRELLPKHIAEELEANDNEVFERNAPIQREEAMIENGEPRTFLSAKFPVETGGKKVVCGIATDITERSRLDQQLQAERARFAMVLDGIDLGTWFCNLPFDNLHWDHRCKAHFGLSADAPVTIETFFDTIVPEDREPTENAINTAIATGGTYDTVFRTQGPVGPIRWIRALGRASYTEDGTPQHFDGITLDVSHSHQVEQSLQQSEERYRSLVQATAAIVWVSDPQGHFAVPQSKWESYTGQPFKEHRGDGWTGAIHPEDREALLEGFSTAAQTKQVYQGSGRVWHEPTRSYRHFEVRAVPLFCPAGEIREWVGTIFDVQERREVELAALESNRVKSEFLANMSHELRTPMTGMRGMLEMLFDTSLTDHQRDCLITIQDCAQGLMAVLDDVLDLSRIEAGNLVLSPRPYELRSAIASTLALFRLQAEERALDLKIEVDTNLPPALLGDPDRVRQVLVNLVSNAMKFTREGAVELTVGVRGERVRFEVRDTGIGIRDEDLERLFVPFVQLDSSTSRQYEGTGLGLSIVRRLVKLMDGELGVESVFGEGSTFWFELPLVEASLVKPKTPANHKVWSPGSLKAHILLVEDNAINRKVVEAQLNKLGLDVTALELGVFALAELRERSYDLIFMDCQMPELDGYETTRRLRRQGVKTPIIALTAHAMPGERERCLKAGMDDYLTKPLSREDLCAALRQWLPLKNEQDLK